jgi:hypothetical protein
MISLASNEDRETVSTDSQLRGHGHTGIEPPRSSTRGRGDSQTRGGRGGV